MECERCGKLMRPIYTVLAQEPITHLCENKECILGGLPTPSVSMAGNMIHAQYYSEDLGRMRCFAHDGDTWAELDSRIESEV